MVAGDPDLLRLGARHDNGALPDDSRRRAADRVAEGDRLHDDDGTVRHAHYVTTLEGAEGRSLDEHEQDARGIAARYGHDVSKLRALHVERLEIPHGRIRVDVAAGTLVETERA